MKRISLDARKMDSRENAHEYMAKKCRFPDYYGKNLDAAYDCLSSLADTEITVKHAQSLEENLGEYGKKIISVFADAALNNEGLQVIIK